MAPVGPVKYLKSKDVVNKLIYVDEKLFWG